MPRNLASSIFRWASLVAMAPLWVPVAILHDRLTLEKRRSQAESPDTPVERLERLAEDSDRLVRTFVAQNPTAPLDLICRMADCPPKAQRMPKELLHGPYDLVWQAVLSRSDAAHLPLGVLARFHEEGLPDTRAEVVRRLNGASAHERLEWETALASFRERVA
ncbi:hypothetical protein WV31_10695 [Magnetospirillum sp. ME-1]|uniref:hypothetical protein n=1 Tax=Magnetospirillum sp. ME-1 TaxID=1639348 RepID=UPI000A17C0D9|nr:hypothetical protein [Magnetospirillum sp. ME-1]ARJ66095.1 hypothetical protein WV31_10695 [Magnetospirillum sp. ME-1]